jgi:hypothetical protein
VLAANAMLMPSRTELEKKKEGWKCLLFQTVEGEKAPYPIGG